MPYSKEMLVIGDRIVVDIRGDYEGVVDLQERMSELSGIADTYKIYKIVLDFSNVGGQIPALEKYELGAWAAKAWGQKLKVALIYLQGENTGMFENVAVNRGGLIRVVGSMEEAIEWLDKEQ